MSYSAGSTEAEAATFTGRQREAQRSSHSSWSQNKSCDSCVLRFKSLKRWLSADHHGRSGRAANPQRKVLEGLQHSRLFDKRDQNSNLSKWLFRPWVVRSSNSSLHLWHVLDARHFLLLGRHRSQLRLVDSLRDRFYLLRFYGVQRNMLGIDIHLSESQSENKNCLVASNSTEKASEVCATPLARWWNAVM